MWGAILGSALGGLFQAGSARSAARAQERSANQQTALARDIYNQQTGYFAPYREAGTNALGAYVDAATARPETFQGPATVTGPTFRDPAAMTGPDYSQLNFRNTPGYQFALSEGQRAIDGSAAARGGVFSGATLRAQQEYGQGLADQTFARERDVFRDDYYRRYDANNRNYWADRSADTSDFWNRTNYNNQNFWQTAGVNEGRQTDYVNRLAGLVNLGQSAAAQTATAAGNFGQNAMAAMSAAGNARAAGAVGVGNAINGGIENALSLWAYQNPPAYNPAATTGATGSSWAMPPARFGGGR